VSIILTVNGGSSSLRFALFRAGAALARIFEGKFERLGMPDSRVDAAMLEELRLMRPFDPEHLPLEILLIRKLSARFPEISQVACFDTGFHRDLPAVARLLPIPREYGIKGIRRHRRKLGGHQGKDMRWTRFSGDRPRPGPERRQRGDNQHRGWTGLRAGHADR
jgi:acetate kinase